MTGNDLRFHTDVMQIGAKAKPQGLDASRLISLPNSQRASYSRKAIGGDQRQIS